MAVEDSVAQDQLRAFIERIERMEDEKSAIAADIKEIYAEAKGNGFDTKILRKLVTIRKQDANERMEQEALLDLYMGALGMGGDVSAAYNDSRRNSIADDIDDDLLSTVAETAKTPEGRKALLDAVEAHKHGVKISQLRASTNLAIVEAANLQPRSENQPSQPAGSDLAVTPPPSHDSKVATHPVANVEEEANGRAVTSDDAASREVDDADRQQIVASGFTGEREPGSVKPVATAQDRAPHYAAPGVIVWEHTPPEPVKRHPYSAAFSDMGQDLAVIDDDIAGAKSEPIVRVGNEILDGWARYCTARGMIGGSGLSAEYPVTQYDGDNALVDCIRWNVAGRIMTDKQLQLAAKRLIEIEPKRKAEILATFEALSA